MKCNANIYFNKQCLDHKVIPAFARLSHVKLIIIYIYIYGCDRRTLPVFYILYDISHADLTAHTVHKLF
jgi:hypothetical protein